MPLTTRICILIGGFFNQFGWVFFGFGLIFVWVFALNADVSFPRFSNNIVTTEGIITNKIRSSASENDRRIFEYHYKFLTPQELEFEGVSYSTRRTTIVGDQVAIEYAEGNPENSKIKGMRKQTFGPFVLFVIIFPLAGLVFIIIGLKKSLKALKLLRYGRISTGKLISKVPTNVRINKRTVYELTFQFKDHLGREHTASEKTHLPHLLEDNGEEQLLYLAENPSYAVMLDSLPSSPKIDRRGDIQATSFIKSLLLLVIPLATLIGHGYYIFLRFIN
ncbi:MAG: DUF3592 domain-containing protein [Candidatus Competibacteraceae bacterium]|nr:DUF3592 domain-containing protein [Candidatus Competibacteraceae bacterium]